MIDNQHKNQHSKISAEQNLDVCIVKKPKRYIDEM